MLMSSWRMDATAFVFLGGGGSMSWASFVGVWGSAESVGSVESVESKKVYSSDGGVWDGRLLLISIFGVVRLVVCVLVSLAGMHAVCRH